VRNDFSVGRVEEALLFVRECEDGDGYEVVKHESTLENDPLLLMSALPSRPLRACRDTFVEAMNDVCALASIVVSLQRTVRPFISEKVHDEQASDVDEIYTADIDDEIIVDSLSGLSVSS
jgi:hypothetical protein